VKLKAVLGQGLYQLARVFDIPLPTGGEFFVGGDQAPASERPFEMGEAYRKVPDVHACVSLIAEALASVPLRFYLGRDPSTRKPLDFKQGNVTALWADPNFEDTSYQFTIKLVSGRMLYGVSYLVLDALVGRRPGILHCPPPNTLRVKRVERGRVVSYTMRLRDGSNVTVDASQVIPFRLYDPEHYLTGLSTVGVSEGAWRAQHNSTNLVSEYYANGGKPMVYFRLTRSVGEVERRRLRAEMIEAARKAGARWHPWLIPEGMEIEAQSVKLSDMGLEMADSILTLKVARALHIPPVLLGIKTGGGLSDAGASTDLLLFWENAVKPHARDIQAVLNERLLGRERWGVELSCEFDFSGVLPLQQVFLEQAKGAQAAAGAPVTSRAEWRERLNLPDTGNAEHKKLLVPIGMSEEGADTSQQPEPADAGAPPPERHTRSADDVLRTRASARMAIQVRAMRAEWLRLFRDQEARIVEAVRERRTLARTLNVDDLLDPNHPGDRRRLRRVLRAIIKARGEEALADLGMDLAFAIRREDVRAFIEARGFQALVQVNGTTLDALRRSLAEGQAAGETEGELVARVRQEFGDRRLNALTIARTETVAPYNFAGRVAWQQAGIRSRRWLTSEDDLVRDAHRAAAAAGAIPMGDPHVLQGPQGPENAMFPGDPALSASLRINCRCTEEPVVEDAVTGEEEALRDDTPLEALVAAES
jgi:HK97 family phage portal protein